MTEVSEGPDKLVYRKAIVTFIDILGFREIVARRGAARQTSTKP